MLRADEAKNAQFLGFTQNYIQKDLTVKQSYLDLMQEVSLKVQRVDFKKPETVQLINNAVANATDQKIKQIVSELSPNTT
jgi:serine protease inhibitor